MYARQLSLDPGSFSQLPWNQTSSGDNLRLPSRWPQVITARTSEDTRGYQKNKISISMISRYIKQLIIFYDQDMKLLTCHKKCQSSGKKKKEPNITWSWRSSSPNHRMSSCLIRGLICQSLQAHLANWGCNQCNPVKSKINIVIYSYNIVISYVYNYCVYDDDHRIIESFYLWYHSLCAIQSIFSVHINLYNPAWGTYWYKVATPHWQVASRSPIKL